VGDHFVRRRQVGGNLRHAGAEAAAPACIQLKPGATVTEQEIIDFCAGKIATFRVPRYVRFVTEWPMSGTKIKKAILREIIAADLKDKGITRAPKISTAPG
jgi:fatty-acyl-CoA synthase